jgi:hypothetical protein
VKTIDFNYKAPRVVGQFMRSDAEFKAILGPFGSGKSVGCCVEILRRCAQQRKAPDGFRYSRWVVIRNVNQQLKDTTLKTWFQWIKPGVLGYWKVTDMTFYLEFNDVKAEILFRALDTPEDVQKVLSLEITGAWLNECQFIPREIVEGLQGRLKRYPSQEMGGSNYWMLIADTNPPAIDTYWHRVFEHLPIDEGDENSVVECDTFKQPSGLAPDADNKENLPADYYEKLAKGKSKVFIDASVHAKYPPSQAGKPVYHATFDRSVHVSPTPLPINPYLPVIVGQDFGLCYDDKTEVLTSSGWKLFKDVLDTDTVATRNPVTKKLEYTGINFKVERKYTGKLIGWSSTEVDFLVTPEHRVPYTRRDYPDNVLFAEASWIANNMTKHLFVDLVSTWEGKSFTPPCGMSMEVYAELCGWLASDGNFELGTTRFCVAQVKEHNDLTALLAKTPFTWNASDIRYRASNEEFYNHFVSKWGRTKTERIISDEIRFAPKEIIEVFLKAFTRGDGHIRVRANGATEWTIFANNYELAGGLQELAQKCGKNSSVRIQRGQVSLLDTGREIISNDGYVVTIKQRAKRAELLKRNYVECDYDGMIYCLNVPYHTLYIRRNGKPSWNGNTPAGLWMQMQENGRIYILRETPAFDMGTKRYIRLKFRPMHMTTFPLNPIIVIGDPSGTRRADSDEGTSFKEFKDAGYIAKPAATNDPEVRIKVLDELFSLFPDRAPAILIDPSCKNFIQAMSSGYRYPRKKMSVAEDYGDKPEKNSFSHLVEGGQYGAMFLTGKRYDPSDYVVYDEGFNPLANRTSYRPAQREGY